MYMSACLIALTETQRCQALVLALPLEDLALALNAAAVTLAGHVLALA